MRAPRSGSELSQTDTGLLGSWSAKCSLLKPTVCWAAWGESESLHLVQQRSCSEMQSLLGPRPMSQNLHFIKSLRRFTGTLDCFGVEHSS